MKISKKQLIITLHIFLFNIFLITKTFSKDPTVVQENTKETLDSKDWIEIPALVGLIRSIHCELLILNS